MEFCYSVTKVTTRVALSFIKPLSLEKAKHYLYLTLSHSYKTSMHTSKCPNIVEVVVGWVLGYG